ncbi:MAG: sulfatase [Phycisphaerales bacterium]
MRCARSINGARLHYHRLLIATLIAILAPVQGAFAQVAPNLVIVLTDDQGIDSIEGAHWPNDLGVHTPNLAELASRGVVFPYTRVNSRCSPTRAGMLTGRHALETGVMGVVNASTPTPDRDQLALQTEERTIAEVLRDMGYYTILIDKWHVGWERTLGQRAEQQGIDAFFDYHDYEGLDDPLEVGDEHVTLMVDLAVAAVNERPDPDQPYALFVWGIDPHRRYDLSRREPMGWWIVDTALLPSGEDYYAPGFDTERNRYRAVVESIDTELARMFRELGVVDESNLYQDESDTVVFFLSDNGTPMEVADRPTHAKGSPFEGGLRVPFFVFGESVPADGAGLDRLVSHLDFFDTISDIIGADPAIRGEAIRHGVSFADAIGWGTPGAERLYTISTHGQPDPADQRVALADREFKLVIPASHPGLLTAEEVEFYDLVNDPLEETALHIDTMSPEQLVAFDRMRQDLPLYWAAGVFEPTAMQIDIPLTHSMSINSRSQQQADELIVGVTDRSGVPAVESRAYYRFDIDAIDSLLPVGSTMDDVVGAEIVLFFAHDSPEADGVDTPPLRAAPASMDWFTRQRSWRMLLNRWVDRKMGEIDLAAHIIVDPEGDKLCGVPLPEGSPLSLGPAEDTLTVVRYWYDNRPHNFGIVVFTEIRASGFGDQAVAFQPTAILRLTLAGQ